MITREEAVALRVPFSDDEELNIAIIKSRMLDNVIRVSDRVDIYFAPVRGVDAEFARKCTTPAGKKEEINAN